MELSSVKYYDHDRFYNSFYLITATLQRYLAQEIFKDDGTRMIYASTAYAFRQRLNQLNLAASQDHNSLKLPFGCIYHFGGWDVDTPRFKATTMLPPTYSATSIHEPVPGRFLNATTTFQGALFFNRDDDARAAYEMLMWMKLPAPKLIEVQGFMYKGVSISIPMEIKVGNIAFAPGTTEKEWLRDARIIPVTFDIQVSSTVLDQYRQGTNSSLFDTYVDDELGEIKLTETVILDFLSYSRTNQYVDQEGLLLEIQSTIAADPELDGSLAFTPELDQNDEPIYEDTSVRLTWDYNDGELIPNTNPAEYEPDVTDLYESQVRIVCSDGTSAYANLTDKVYTYSGLSANSSYEFSIFFIAKSGAVTKYTTTGSTTAEILAPNLKGMVGLTW